MILLLDTGLRLSEVSGLCLGDLNFNENHIKVMGKGAKERAVPMQRKLRKILKEYLVHRGSEPDHDFVFVTIDNNPVTNRGIQQRIEIISRNALATDTLVTQLKFGNKMVSRVWKAYQKELAKTKNNSQPDIILRVCPKYFLLLC